MTTLSPENSLSARQSASFILVKRKPPIDKTEWDGFFDENGHLAKSRDFICVNILERGLHPFVRTEAWKFLTGYYSWQSSQDERLTVDSTRRKNYEALCQMYEKIQPLLENLHRNFTETRNNITYDIQKLYDKDPLGNVLIDKKRLEKILLLSYVCNTEAEYQQGFHDMVMLFHLMVEHDHETFWLFQFFLQKTEHSCVINIGVGKNLDMLNILINFLDPVFSDHLKGKGAGAVQSLFPWFCLCFQHAFKSFDDVWRLWEMEFSRMYWASDSASTLLEDTGASVGPSVHLKPPLNLLGAVQGGGACAVEAIPASASLPPHLRERPRSALFFPAAASLTFPST